MQDVQDNGVLRGRSSETRWLILLILLVGILIALGGGIAFFIEQRSHRPVASHSAVQQPALPTAAPAQRVQAPPTQRLDQPAPGRIAPHVTIQGVDVASMTPAEATQALQARFASFLQAPLRFEYAGQSWQPTPAEIGLQTNLQDQISAAMRVGRGDAGATGAAEPV